MVSKVAVRRGVGAASRQPDVERKLPGRQRNARMTRESPFWEAAYEDLDAETFGAASEEIVELASILPSGARALDMGCGDGRNALCLAEHGVEVDAVDSSWAAIRKMSLRARAADVPVRGWVQDISTLVFRAQYDLACSMGSCTSWIGRHGAGCSSRSVAVAQKPGR